MITREEIKERYPVRPLGEVAEFMDNRRKPVKEADRKPGPYPYYGANGLQGTIDGYLFDEPIILLAEDGGFFDNPDRGIAYRVTGKSWVNNHAHVLKPKPGLDFDFLCRVLENYDVMPYISGSTRAKLTKGQAEKIEIPLPPLDEQKRIAAILDQADELRRKRKQALDRLDQLGQAIFYEMFGDIRTAYQRFGGRKFEEIADVRLGKMLDKGKSKGGSMRPYLRNANVRWFTFDLADILEMELSDNELDRFSLKNDDLLICEGGEPGRCAVWRYPSRVMYYQKALHRARLNTSLALPDFVAHWFHNAAKFGMLADSVTSATIAHLTGEKIKKLEIFLPAIDEQTEFFRRLSAVEKMIACQKLAEGVIAALFQTLQHRAFRGELSASSLREATA